MHLRLTFLDWNGSHPRPKDNLFWSSLAECLKRIKWMNIALKLILKLLFQSNVRLALYWVFMHSGIWEKSSRAKSHVDFLKMVSVLYSVHFARLKLTMGGKVEFNSREFSQEISQICSITDHANDWTPFQPPEAYSIFMLSKLCEK